MKLLRTIPAFPVHRIDDAVKFYETIINWVLHVFTKTMRLQF